MGILHQEGDCQVENVAKYQVNDSSTDLTAMKNEITEVEGYEFDPHVYILLGASVSL